MNTIDMRAYFSIRMYTWLASDGDSSYGPSIGVPESAELFDETLSRRLN